MRRAPTLQERPSRPEPRRRELAQPRQLRLDEHSIQPRERSGGGFIYLVGLIALGAAYALWVAWLDDVPWLRDISWLRDVPSLDSVPWLKNIPWPKIH